jgi:hypothetical protein
LDPFDPLNLALSTRSPRPAMTLLSSPASARWTRCRRNTRCTVYFVRVGLSSLWAGFPSTTRSVDIPGATCSADHGCVGARITDSRLDRTLRGFEDSGGRPEAAPASGRQHLPRSSLITGQHGLPCQQRANPRCEISRAAQEVIQQQTRTQPAPARIDAACVGGDVYGCLRPTSAPTLLPFLVGRGRGWVDAGVSQGRTLTVTSIPKFASICNPALWSGVACEAQSKKGISFNKRHHG